MTRQLSRVGLVLVLVFSLSACQSVGPREQIGGLIGGGAGALIGSQFGGGDGQIAMAVIGALLGYAVGSEVGRQLDENDARLARENAWNSLESSRDRKKSTWRNPNTGHSGTFVPLRTYSTFGTPCRDYETTVKVGQELKIGHGTACRQSDGTWKIQ
jgi:surface antigen